MESSSLGIIRTPNRANSEGPVPPPRNSMEDADSSITRKRPRLDSGDRAYRSMSADGKPSAELGAEPGKLLPSSQAGDQTQNSGNNLRDISSQPSDATPTKVTINVREPALAISASQLASRDSHASSLEDSRVPSNPSQGSSLRITGSPPQILTEMPSSPPQSPEIEVAELEDIDGHNGPTVWMAHESTTNFEDIQSALLQEFPFVEQYNNSLIHTIAAISGAMSAGALGDGHLVKDLALWIDDYLQQTEPATSQWFNLFTEAREFWEKLPTIVNELVRRTGKFDNNFIRLSVGEDTPEDNRKYLLDLLSAYAALTARMLQVDCQTLTETAEDTGVTPDLVSQPYLRVLTYLFWNSKDLPLYKTLHGVYDIPMRTVVQQVIERFASSSSNGIHYLTQYVDMLLERTQTVPNVVADIMGPINTIHRISQFFPKGEERPQQPITSTTVIQAFQFFQTIEAKFQAFIRRQVPSLSLELMKVLIAELSPILTNTLLANASLIDTMIPAGITLPGDTNLKDRTLLAQHAWRFDICKNCITKGRMEIRVQGIDTMQEDLVANFQTHVSGRDIRTLLVLPDYLSRSILDSKLVDYLVGVESHPQLIQRSKNIVGFLVVTGRYTEAETDIIWKTVASTPDSRTIDAILDMLSGILSIMNYPQLLYLCQKLNDLPIRYFDARMLVHCRLLLEHLIKKWLDPEISYGESLDMPPYKLCLRLLREAVADASFSPSRKQEIYQIATNELGSLMRYGPSIVSSASILDQCIEDVSSRSAMATGSVAALNVLLEHDFEGKATQFAGTFDFTTLVVDEFVVFSKLQSSTSFNSIEFHDALRIRFSLLQRIITSVPDTIPPELGEKLWRSMLGEPEISEHARNMAWKMLARVLPSCRLRNSFLERSVSELFPRLDPCYLTWGVLEFAEKVVQYEFRSRKMFGHREENQPGPPGADLLWHLSLAVPNPITAGTAIEMLVRLYLDGSLVHHPASSVADGSDARLVDRCIQQLIKTASKLKRLNDGTSSGEDETMVIIPLEAEVSVEKIYFTRSLSILKAFMQGIRARTPESPSSKSLPQSPCIIHGEKVQIKYQYFSTGFNSGVRELEFGDLSTYADFVMRMSKLTGFSKLTVIAGGQKLDETTYKDTLLRELKLHQKGLILIKIAQNAESVPEETGTTTLRPLEIEVMKHFHDLYSLLGMDDHLGSDVYDLLGTFPPHEDIIKMVCNEETQSTTMLPADAPYKTIYSLYTLKFCLTKQLQHGTTSNHLIRHGIQSIVAALLDTQTSSERGLCEAEIVAAVGLIECLLRFLKEPVPIEISITYFNNSSAFVDRLRQLMTAAQASEMTAQTAYLVQICFSTMLEASLHSKSIWDHFKGHVSSSQLLQSLILENANEKVREGAEASIRSVCSVMPSIVVVEAQEFVSFFWDNVVKIIPETIRYSQNTEQFFRIALEVFRQLDENSQKQLQLASYMQRWGTLLLECQHNEFVGREHVDWTVFGLAGLLHWCIQLMKSKKTPLNIDTSLVPKIFYAHLFPTTFHTGVSPTLVRATTPILDSSTRGRLYSVLLALSTDLDGYRNLLSLVKNLVPQGEESHAWSWGVAQIVEDYQYEANWNFERMKSIRSPTGFPGLRNLANTCYLNSLFTQLFMNVSFRGFMLSRNIADGEASQKLLAETQKLFSYMQESWLKCVDPQSIADSIVTFEGSLIDVNIQMDVEEFYNLLFDRWESQIPSEADKKTFRQFYGGQIVQQIKSTECPHISERLEPFSAIQCEIQGKATLAASLEAYVEGEVMEGDNKYSCSSCGCYVNAVKRASLKDIPDNLIFHLKRFNYDVSGNTRHKVNDHFEFPEDIDMSLYTVEYLSGSTHPSGEDKFVLVGILVHSGSTDSGHYYSFIRERPIKAGDPPSWIECNDADVAKFEPVNIPDQCFGGLSDANYPAPRYPKTWNAYMLFYQRASSLETEWIAHPSTTIGIPVKETAPVELEAQIALENEMFIRKFCLFDPEHAKFIKSLLEQHRTLSSGLCSDDHVLERELISLTLAHLDQVFSRTKDCPDFHVILDIIVKLAGTCSECCKLTLDWVTQHEHALRNLLLRSPDEDIRKRFSKMLVGALKYLRLSDPPLYGTDEDGFDQDVSGVYQLSVRPGALHDMVKRLKDLWLVMHLHSRAWDEYYEMCNDVARLGRLESAIMHKEGYLGQCLQVLVVDYNHGGIKRLRNDIPHHAHFFRMLEKGRKFSYKHLLALTATLLRSADLAAESVEENYDEALQITIPYPLRVSEEEILRFGAELPRSKGLIFLDKAISVDCNTPACQEIIRSLLRAEEEYGLVNFIEVTITVGVSIDPASGARPYLQAALAFCEACPIASLARHLVASIASEVETIGNSGGDDHLEFFQSARRIRNDNFSKDPFLFHNLVRKLVPQWAPTLLMYPDISVRLESISLLQTLVFAVDIRNMDDEEKAEEVENIGRELCKACLRRINKHIIQPRKSIEATVVIEIIKVIRHCLAEYFSEEEEDGHMSLLTQSETILEQLSGLTVSSPEDVLSGEYDSEEVLTDFSNDYN